MVSFTEKIKQKALEIGFHKIGIARAEPLDAEGERLKQWLGKNYHGEMHGWNASRKNASIPN